MTAARDVAYTVIHAVGAEDAYANLVLGPILAASGLDDRDRRFATELVYGTTRMRRACEHLVARHRRGGVTPRVAAALRLGAYQLAFAGVAPHAAVSATVGASPKAARGLVNAVLRRVADDVARLERVLGRSFQDWLGDSGRGTFAVRRSLAPSERDASQ